MNELEIGTEIKGMDIGWKRKGRALGFVLWVM